ncbi:MAG: hypothetical protein E7328_03330 [Clostridiales bacterium]|nr:hypothetical protein [Clostridiales bacterium]
MATVKEMYINKENGREQITACALQENHGLVGDSFAGEGPRQVSICEVNATRDGGLCGPKYQANLVLEGVDFDALQVGDVLSVGSAKLELTIKGKKCFPQCEIVQSGKVCYLKNHCAFLAVAQAGEVAVGDEVTING